MTALADNSDMVLWPWWGWCVAVLLVVAVGCLVSLLSSRDEAEPEVRPLHLVPATPEPHYLSEWECWVHDCDRIGARWVEHDYAGHLFVCGKCATDGYALGWWKPRAESRA